MAEFAIFNGALIGLLALCLYGVGRLLKGENK